MSLYNYVDVPNNNLICCICRTPFTDPVTTHTCAHTFCRDCIIRAMEHSAQCPVDRSPLSPSSLAPANPIVRSLVDELVVECVHRAEGCMYTCQRQLLPAHLLDSCAYREVSCPHGRCDETMAYKDSVGHVHQEAGILNKGNALETDGAVLAAPTREEASPECTSTPMSPVDEPQSHETTSSESSITPIISTTTPERHLAALTSQNILLRHRVDTLESLLSCVRRELGTVKRALGPWAMAKEQGQGLASRDTGSYFSTELPLSAQPASASTSTGPVNAEGAAPPTHLQPVETFNLSPQAPYPHPWQYGNGSTAPPHMPPTDSLARYFPAEVEDISLSARQRQAVRAHHASSSVEFPGPHPRQGYEMFTSANNVANAHLHLPPPPPLVAPLNLGTTLEGTLHGLRESVVGLAVSVDSLGRRQEIALTNETTRMAEEVGGLRAGLHGLRMQIHAIMMDRNAQLTGRDGVGAGDAAGNGQWLGPAPTRPFYPQQASITKL